MDRPGAEKQEKVRRSPEILVRNRQRAVKLPIRWVRRFAETVLPLCLQQSDDGAYALGKLDEVVIDIISDRAIAAVHVQYMDVPGSTDVITFQHGDIVISAETARARADGFGYGVEQELALYIVHALLHLNGFDDTSQKAATRMRKIQDRLWKEGLAKLPPPPPEQ